jgi:hypothetical protein
MPTIGYSASGLLRQTLGWWREDQEIKLCPINIHYLDVDRLGFGREKAKNRWNLIPCNKIDTGCKVHTSVVLIDGYLYKEYKLVVLVDHKSVCSIR